MRAEATLQTPWIIPSEGIAGLRCANRVEKQAKAVLELERFRRATRAEGSHLPRNLQRILSCIHEHLYDPQLNVKTVKIWCEIFDNNITSRFRHVIGLSIKDYIESLRMRAADQLLKDDDIAVLDIAMNLGYDHPQTFYRAFHRWFGCTPTVYRKSRCDGPTAPCAPCVAPP